MGRAGVAASSPVEAAQICPHADATCGQNYSSGIAEFSIQMQADTFASRAPAETVADSRGRRNRLEQTFSRFSCCTSFVLK